MSVCAVKFQNVKDVWELVLQLHVVNAFIIIRSQIINVSVFKILANNVKVLMENNVLFVYQHTD